METFMHGHQSSALSESYLRSIDLRDLSRGEGEWRNMQEVIRRTFRCLFEQIHHQQLQITTLSDSITTIKKESHKKANSSEISGIIDSKMAQYVRSASVDDLNSLRTQIAEIRSNLEKKANIRYVDDSLQRKANKTDLLFPHHPHPYSSSSVPTTAPSYSSTSSQFLEPMNLKISSIEQRLVAMETMMKLSTEHDQILFQSQLNDLKAKVSSKVDVKEMETALLSRVEKADLDIQLHHKADRNSMNEVSQSPFCYSDSALLSSLSLLLPLCTLPVPCRDSIALRMC
jgi:hypothetical protein